MSLLWFGIRRLFIETKCQTYKVYQNTALFYTCVGSMSFNEYLNEGLFETRHYNVLFV